MVSFNRSRLKPAVLTGLAFSIHVADTCWLKILLVDYNVLDNKKRRTLAFLHIFIQNLIEIPLVSFIFASQKSIACYYYSVYYSIWSAPKFQNTRSVAAELASIDKRWLANLSTQDCILVQQLLGSIDVVNLQLSAPLDEME